MQASFLEAICFCFQTIRTPRTLSALAFLASRWTLVSCAGELCAVVAGHWLPCIFSGEAGRKNTWAGFPERGSGLEQTEKQGRNYFSEEIADLCQGGSKAYGSVTVRAGGSLHAFLAEESTGGSCSAGSQSTALGTCSRGCNALDGGFPCRYFQSHFFPVGSGEPCRGPAQRFPLQLAAC